MLFFSAFRNVFLGAISFSRRINRGTALFRAQPWVKSVKFHVSVMPVQMSHRASRVLENEHEILTNFLGISHLRQPVAELYAGMMREIRHASQGTRV